MKQIAVVLMFFFAVFNRPALAEQTIVLGSSYSAPVTSEQKDGLLDLVYQELSRRLGIKIEIQNLAAAERVLLNANSGVDDGDVGRILGLEKKYPNLISVPVPVMKYQMVVFARNLDFEVSGVESIKPYNVGIVRGWKILEAASAGAHSVTVLDSGDQLFSMLDKGRIDIALLEKLQGLEIIKKLGIHGIKVLKLPLLEGNWYLYVNKKHEALVPRLTSALRKMEEDGTIERISNTVLNRYGR